MKPSTIVIAWAKTIQEWDGEPFAADLGARAGMVEKVEPQACVWLRGGKERDMAKAEAFCRKENSSLEPGEYSKVVYQITNKADPLKEAKRVYSERYTTK